jgi:hypothetical protein
MKNLFGKMAIAGIRIFCAGQVILWAWRTWIFRGSPPDVGLGILMVLGFGVLTFLPWRREKEASVDAERAKREIDLIKKRQKEKSGGCKRFRGGPGSGDGVGRTIAAILGLLSDGQIHRAREIVLVLNASSSSLTLAKQRGYVSSPKWGYYRITERGRGALESYKTKFGAQVKSEPAKPEPDVWALLRARATKGYVPASALLKICDDPVEFARTWKSGKPSKMIRTKTIGGVLHIHLEDFRKAREEFERMKAKAGAQ